MTDVLIVDDDESLRAVMREILEDEGYAIQTAADGRTALTVLAASPIPLVVVLDMRLPGLDGLGLLARISEAAPTPAHQHAFILCTAGRTDFAKDVQALLERTRTTLLPKPFDLDELLFHVESAARRLAKGSEKCNNQTISLVSTSNCLHSKKMRRNV